MLVNVRQVSKELSPRHWGKKKLLFGYSAPTPWALRICTCISLIVSTENKKRILIRSEFSIMSKTWGTIISSAFFFLQLQHYQSKWEILLNESIRFDSFTFQSAMMFKKMSSNDFTMMLIIPVAGITAAEGQEVGVLQMENSASPPPYFFCRTQCCLRLVYHYRISAGQVKQNILGSKLSFG